MFNRTGSSSSISCEAPPHNTGVGSETSLCPTMEGSDTSTIQGYNGYIKPFSNSVKDGKYMEIVGPKFKSFMLYSTGILQVYYRYVRYVLTITEPPCFIRPRWRYPQRGVELEESELLEWMGSSKHIVLGHDCKP